MVAFRSIISGLALAEATTVVDWDKVTNFQTDFAVHATNYPPASGYPSAFAVEGKSANLAGHMQFDLDSGKFKVHVTSHDDEALLVHGMPKTHLNGGTSTLVVDEKSGYAYYKEDLKFTQVQGESSFCVKFALPPHLLPPASFLKQQLEHIKPQIEGVLTHGPASKVTSNEITTYSIGGKPSASAPDYIRAYPYRVEELKMTTDGTPVGASSHWYCLENEPSCDSELSRRANFDVEFSNWQKGAGDVAEPEDCIRSSSSQTGMQSGMSLVALQEMGQQLSQLAPTQELGWHFMELATTMRGQIHSQSPAQSSTWHSIAVPFAAGISGAAAVFAFVRIFKGKRAQDEYLLSQA